MKPLEDRQLALKMFFLRREIVRSNDSDQTTYEEMLELENEREELLSKYLKAKFGSNVIRLPIREIYEK